MLPEERGRQSARDKLSALEQELVKALEAGGYEVDEGNFLHFIGGVVGVHVRQILEDLPPLEGGWVRVAKTICYGEDVNLLAFWTNGEHVNDLVMGDMSLFKGESDVVFMCDEELTPEEIKVLQKGSLLNDV